MAADNDAELVDALYRGAMIDSEFMGPNVFRDRLCLLHDCFEVALAELGVRPAEVALREPAAVGWPDPAQVDATP